MYTLKMKKWFHVPSRHDAVLKFEHLVHNERFWPIVILAAITVMIIALSFWATISTESGSGEIPVTPFPYNF